MTSITPATNPAATPAPTSPTTTPAAPGGVTGHDGAPIPFPPHGCGRCTPTTFDPMPDPGTVTDHGGVIIQLPPSGPHR